MIPLLANPVTVDTLVTKLNDYQPTVTVDPETYQVRADGELLTCEPATMSSEPSGQRTQAL